MIWLFERGERVARLVPRIHPGSGIDVLEMECSDGLVTTERLSESAAFRARHLALEQQLEAEEMEAGRQLSAAHRRRWMEAVSQVRVGAAVLPSAGKGSPGWPLAADA